MENVLGFSYRVKISFVYRALHCVFGKGAKCGRKKMQVKSVKVERLNTEY